MPNNIIPLMTESEARSCIDGINGHLRNARTLILDLYEREGWKVLGYLSWRECVSAEFQHSQTHMYRQLAAAFVEKVISPNGEIGVIHETHVRPLTSLTPDKQQLAWQVAQDTAPNGKVTEVHVPGSCNQPQPE